MWVGGIVFQAGPSRWPKQHITPHGKPPHTRGAESVMPVHLSMKRVLTNNTTYTQKGIIYRSFCSSDRVDQPLVADPKHGPRRTKVLRLHLPRAD